MPHYYFDVHDGIEVVDDVGRDLPDIDAAKSQAFRVASSFAMRPKMLSELGGAIIVEVRDAPNSIVLKVRLVFNIERL